MTDATLEGVSQDAPADEPVVIDQDASNEDLDDIPPQRAGMDAIVANRRKQFAENGVDLDAPEPETTAVITEPEPVPIEPEPEPTPEPQATPEPGPTTAGKPVELSDDDIVNFKIDGEIVEIKWGDAKRTAQKNAAADKRLYEATQIKRAAEEQAAAMAEPPEPEPEPTPEFDVDSIIHDIQYGSQEEGATAIKSLVNASQGRQETATPEQIATYAANRATQEIALKQESNRVLTIIGEEYPDIFADQNLTSIAAREFTRVQEEGQLLGETITQESAMRTAAVRTLEWRDAMNGTSKPETAAQSLADKAALKRNSDQQPSAASMTQPAPPKDEPVSKSNMVEQMRKDRGLAPNGG